MTCEEVQAFISTRNPATCTRAERNAINNHMSRCQECLDRMEKKAATHRATAEQEAEAIRLAVSDHLSGDPEIRGPQ